jgi:hypothetical protein
MTMSSLTLEDHEITVRIPTKGKCEFHRDGEKYSLGNGKPQTEVYAHLTEWSTAMSVHMYGVLIVPHIDWRIGWVRQEWVDKDTFSPTRGKTFWGEGPRKSGFGRLVVEITKVANYDIMNFDYEGQRKITVRAGERTNRFDNSVELMERLRTEFGRIFGDDYTLDTDTLKGAKPSPGRRAGIVLGEEAE